MTNFVLFKVDRDRRAFIEALRARNVLMDEYAHGQVRAVTHHDVAAADIDHGPRRRSAGHSRTTGRACAGDGHASEQLQGV